MHTQHTSSYNPHLPINRANPCPEVTDPFCRLPLPTLFYEPEAVNLGDLLRIWVRLGARGIAQRCSEYLLLHKPLPHIQTHHEPTNIFKGRTERIGHHKSRGAIRCLHPYLWMIQFQGFNILIRKDNSYRDSIRRLLDCLCYHFWWCTSHRVRYINLPRFQVQEY